MALLLAGRLLHPGAGALLYASAPSLLALLRDGAVAAAAASSGARAGHHGTPAQLQPHQAQHGAGAPACLAEQPWRALACAGGGAAAAHMHHAAVQLDAGSDDEAPAARSQAAPGAQPQQQQPQQPHRHHHAGQAHHGHASSSHGHGHGHHHVHRYTGHLHVPKRHATSSVDSFISEQLLSCKSLGMLRRVFVKHKAVMDPQHVADALLCLQHLVLLARAERAAPGGGGGRAAAQHGTSAARAQPRVRAAAEFSRSKPRVAESDGHMEQLMSQMLGELGNMIWFGMGDMRGDDLAKLLYSWARLEWHPEPELLADVKASFLAAAGAGGPEQQPQPQPGALEAQPWQPWMAAGLWGLVRLGEAFEAQTLALMLVHAPELLPLWSPQQLADLAWALTAVADGSDAGAQQQLQPVVLALARQFAAALPQQPGGQPSGDWVGFVPWPDAAVVQAQARPSRPGAPEPPAHHHASLGRNGAGAAALPQLAWRVLQALVAVGVDVAQPETSANGSLVAALTAATAKPAAQQC